MIVVFISIYYIPSKSVLKKITSGGICSIGKNSETQLLFILNILFKNLINACIEVKFKNTI